MPMPKGDTWVDLKERAEELRRELPRSLDPAVRETELLAVAIYETGAVIAMYLEALEGQVDD